MSKRDKDDDLETLFALRIAEDRVRFWRQLGQVIIMLGGLCIGFAIFGGMQYWACYLKDPNIKLMECFRADRIVKRK